MKRPCLDCRTLIEKGSRCRRCMTNRRGTSSEQATWRRHVLAASGGKCVVCGGREGIEAHHLEALEDGGRWDGPGVALCPACHRLLHS
jgi:predicted HNH restriction endonuclease